MFTIILAGATLALFLIYFFYTGAGTAAYLRFVLIGFPFMDIGVTPAAFGGLTVFDAITYMSIFLCYKDFLKPIVRNKVHIYLFATFVSLVFLGSIASEFVSQSLWGITGIITPFIFCRFLLIQLQKYPAFLFQYIHYLKLAFLVGVGFIVLQMIFGVGFTFYPALNQNVQDAAGTRYPGMFMDSQFSGVFCAMAAFLFLINTDEPGKPLLKNYIMFGVLSLAVLAAGSRSGLLCLAAGVAFLLLFVAGNFRVLAISFIVIIAVVVFIFSDKFVVFSRFGDINDSVKFRGSIWDGAYEIFTKNFTLGIGLNNYKDYVSLHSQDQFLLLDNNEYFFLDAPENGYLKLLSEFGFYAFASLMLMIVWPFFKIMKLFLNGHKHVLSFFFLASIVALFVSAISFYPLSDSRIIIMLCSFIAFALSYSKNKKMVYA